MKRKKQIAPEPDSLSTDRYVYKVEPGNESCLVREALKRRSAWWRAASSTSDACDFLWSANDDRASSIGKAERLGKRHCVRNKLRHGYEASKKHYLARNLARNARVDMCTLTPLTFAVTSPSGDTHSGQCQQLDLLRRAASKRSGAWFVVKPVASNRGRGIEIVSGLSGIESKLNRSSPGSRWVVQKYVPSLLLDGRKFDIRLLLLVCSSGIYLHMDGYARTCSTRLDGSDCSEHSAHLTNDAVQVKSAEYGAAEDHNKLSLPELDEALARNPADNGRVLSITNDLWEPMCSITRHVVEATLMPRNHSQRQRTRCSSSNGFCPYKQKSERATNGRAERCACTAKCDNSSGNRVMAAEQSYAEKDCSSVSKRSFELLGLDFLLERSTGKPLLLEVNMNPALQRKGRHLEQMLPNMIEELVQITLDPIFPPPKGTAADLPKPLNRFQKIM